MTTTVAIVQSSPTTATLELYGRTVIEQIILRLHMCSRIDRVVVAASARAIDDPIAAATEGSGAELFRGPAYDAIANFLAAARAANADRVVRIAGDGPLLDPALVDRVIGALTRDVDYASNTVVRTYPAGLDVEVFHVDVLERMHRLAGALGTRHDVTALLREPGYRARFTIQSVADAYNDNSDLCWSVTIPQGHDEVMRLCTALDLGRRVRPYQELVKFARSGRLVDEVEPSPGAVGRGHGEDLPLCG